jgi:hypothetical protein
MKPLLHHIKYRCVFCDRIVPDGYLRTHLKFSHDRTLNRQRFAYRYFTVKEVNTECPFNAGDTVLCQATGLTYLVLEVFKKSENGGYYLKVQAILSFSQKIAQISQRCQSRS